MKKKLEAELISLAHRILKLKGKEDVISLHQEAQKVYEKLSILRFYEENFEALKPTLTHEELEEKMEAAYEEKPIATEAPKVEEVAAVIQEAKPIAEATTEEIPVEEEKILVGQVDIDENEIDEEPVVVAEEEEAEEIIEPLFEPTAEETVEEQKEEVKEEEKQPQQISFEDLLGDAYKEPEFVKVDDVPSEVEKVADVVFEKAEEPVVVEKAAVEEPIAEKPKKEKAIADIKEEIAKEKEEYKTASLNLNDKFSKTITLGLNDRITFEKYLFDGSGEDLNRVISQLNTFNTLEEAKNFIDDLVKPDYNNWKGKDEFEQRFMELVEKKFA
ncbi:hypothetical protein [Flavobacterium suncheonense]|uniref:Uncharacterized protein n=1 Tax=Flavobacterium suncheonense GH29-5 = DSM 17707 TaxID=1121899 RepID=A0A0A2MDM7_9FLAO|nr:hypothetical protein [Flavobacterium suncheonense]KGO90394.1 hypothetical protein Q764_02245 [Flavobacterium suncheonense GH29-5 = DSM 17707]